MRVVVVLHMRKDVGSELKCTKRVRIEYVSLVNGGRPWSMIPQEKRLASLTMADRRTSLFFREQKLTGRNYQ